MTRVLEIAVVGLAVALYAFLLGGVAMRHVPGGEILGRYSALYAFALLVLGLGILPFALFVRSLFRESRARSEEREIVLTSRTKLALAGAVLLLVLLPLELALWRSATRRTDHDLEKFHPFLQIQGRADRASRHHNRHGFRGDEIAIERPTGDDATRIFFLGGSTVYCMRVPFEKTHVRLLEQRLREYFPERRFEVQNAGVDWYTTAHSLTSYQLRIKDFQPDLVILYHGINDLVRSFSPPALAFGAPRADYAHYYGPIARLAFGRHGKPPIPTPHLLDWLLEPGRLYSDRDRTKAARIDRFPSLAPFARNLRSLVDATRADGVRLVLATQPYLFREDLGPEETDTLWMPQHLAAQDGVYPDPPSMARGMAAFNEATRRVASERGVPWIPLEAAVPKRLDYFVDGVHYTEAGNVRVSEVVFEGLLASGAL